jgi:hypothetical protein
MAQRPWGEPVCNTATHQDICIHFCFARAHIHHTSIYKFLMPHACNVLAILLSHLTCACYPAFSTPYSWIATKWFHPLPPSCFLHESQPIGLAEVPTASEASLGVRGAEQAKVLQTYVIARDCRNFRNLEMQPMVFCKNNPMRRGSGNRYGKLFHLQPLRCKNG